MPAHRLDLPLRPHYALRLLAGLGLPGQLGGGGSHDMRQLAAGAAAAAALLTAPVVDAKTEILAQSGSWAAFGGTTEGGEPVCGVSAEPAGKYFGLKQYGGGNTFTIQLGAKGFPAEPEEKMPITLRFDNNPTWRATAIGMRFSDGDTGLQISVKRDEIDRFFQEFRQSSVLRLKFEKSGAADWVLGLEGTMALGNAFLKCIRTLK